MKRLILAALVLLAGTASSWAADKKWHVSGKLGLSLGGDVNIDPPDRDFEVDSHMQFSGDVDAMVAEKLSVGGRFKLSFPEVGDEGETLLGIGPTIKAHFQPHEKLKVSPGIAILYHNLSSVAGGDNVTGLGTEFFAEVGTPITKDLDLIGEFGFNAQPTGGNNDVDVTWAPMFYLVFGVRY